MDTIEEIERAVVGLSPEELAEFRAWFLEFDVATWDREFEQDAIAGRLDAFAEEALGNLRASRNPAG